MNKFVILFSILFLTAWVSTSNFRASQSLPSTQGLLLTNCQGPWNRILAIYESDYEVNPMLANVFLESDAIISCSTDDELTVIPLEEGSYYLNLANNPAKIKSNMAPNFKIKANKINYIGDLHLGLRSNRSVAATTHHFTLSVDNNFEKTKQRFILENPDIAKRYKIVSDIAEVPSSK